MIIAPGTDGPDLARLDPRTGPAVLRGGEGGSEMGAWNGLGVPFRRANLAERLTEFVRIGFAAGILDAEGERLR